MTLAEIYSQLQNLAIAERRKQEEGFIELVFNTQDAEAWRQALEKIFGPAVKPVNEKPNAEALRLTKVFGGIRREQTLFYKEFDQQGILAMFWPWQSGQSTTLKIIRCANPGQTP